jgi:uncharacterized protein YoxC
MKAILYIVAVLAICGAAYFSYDHSQKFAALEKDRLATTDTNKSVVADTAVAEKGVKDETAKRDAAKERRDLLTQSVSALKSSGTALNSDLSNLNKELKGQDAEFAQLEKALEEVNAILENLGGGVTLDTLPAKIQELEADKQAKQAKLEELETLVAGAGKTLETGRTELDRLGKRMVERTARIGNNSVEAVVTAVNQEWGFVVIGAGSNSNFTPQTTLLVQRDGMKIGRVSPSSIEPTQTIAEIEFETLSPGVRIQAGDRVILAKPASN